MVLKPVVFNLYFIFSSSFGASPPPLVKTLALSFLPAQSLSFPIQEILNHRCSADEKPMVQSVSSSFLTWISSLLKMPRNLPPKPTPQLKN